MFIVSASNPLTWILDINRLIKIDYIDWLIYLRIILSFKKLSNILYQIILMLTTHPTHSRRAILDEWMDNINKDRCYILKSMLDELQHIHKHMFIVNNTLIHLQVLWDDQSRTVHLMRDGQSVYDRYLIIIKDIKELKRLDMIMHKELFVDLILWSLINLYG